MPHEVLFIMVSYEVKTVTKRESVKVSYLGRMVGLVQFNEFVTSSNPGSEAEFVTISEHRF